MNKVFILHDTVATSQDTKNSSVVEHSRPTGTGMEEVTKPLHSGVPPVHSYVVLPPQDGTVTT
eukprot:13078441-Ditylum_brightwellii.AAC.1